MKRLPLLEARTSDVNRIAKEFSDILKSWLSKDEIEELIAANAKEEDEEICHSHDYCDPNQAMIDAFKKIKGKDINFQSDKDLLLMNNAWNLAKKENFYQQTKITEAISKGDLSFDDAKAISKYKNLFSIKKIGYKPGPAYVRIMYKLAREMSASALDEYIKKFEYSLRMWNRLVSGSTLAHNDEGRKAESEWKAIVNSLHNILDTKQKDLNLKSGSGKSITVKGGKIYIDGKVVTCDKDFGYVHLDGKGPAQQMSVGTFTSGDSGKNQLQGIKYTSVFGKFRRLVVDGKTWEEIDEFMTNKSRGPIHGESYGTTWAAIKKYLGL